MTDWNQFEEFDEVRDAKRPAACQVCEAMLPDAVDGVLSEAEQRAFDRHLAGCVVCSREMEEAQRGAAWLGLLKQQAPEPSPALLERILAQTTGAHAMITQTAAAPAPADVQLAAERAAGRAAERAAALPVDLPVWTGASLPVPAMRTTPKGASGWTTVRGAFSLAWMKPLLQPRMAMTAAMAFFSIALTLNLTGVRLSELSTASLRPAAVRRVVADRSAAAVRSFQNMRVVYQAEAQVNDLRSNWQAARDIEETPAPQPRQQEAKPKQKNPENLQGSSELNFPLVAPQGHGMTKKGA